jgi:hypothetical protein
MTATEIPTTPLLNESEAASFFGIEPGTLRLWRRRRGLPHIRITKRVVRYRQTDLEAWLESRAVATGAS